MKLAAISDIHGNSAALAAVLDDIDRRGVDVIVNLGDCFSGPLDPAGTASVLAERDLPTVRGNHDRLLIDRPVGDMGTWEAWAIGELSGETLDWCRSLPLTLDLGDVLLCHGTPDADDENWLDRRGAAHRMIARDLDGVLERAGSVMKPMTLCGHTHTPRSLQLPDGRRIVNPGSVGCPAYLDTRIEPNFVQQTGSADARYAILEGQGERWTVALISVAYDPGQMVQMAEAKGATTWGRALETGWWA